ncbi:hypothetical protein DPMN_018189 [Dreissena polymorpha]|uniref:Uncharacterized protein n=1 Tax=Dreissena polymorpha TaxID=45954 RepID=A0A9D4S8W7_DREPO|nr:hypothetical protein DPMN_018189 [Dreissena polymorpha]
MYIFTRLLPDGYLTVHDHFLIAIRPYTSSVSDPLDLYPSYFRSLCMTVVQPSRSGCVKIWWRSSCGLLDRIGLAYMSRRSSENQKDG